MQYWSLRYKNVKLCALCVCVFGFEFRNSSIQPNNYFIKFVFNYHCSIAQKRYKFVTLTVDRSSVELFLQNVVDIEPI